MYSSKNSNEQNLELIVLAGGLGSRLSALLPDLPKALAPVGSQPFLFHQLDHWQNKGILQITLMLHHKSHLIIDAVSEAMSKGRWKGMKVNWLVEKELLGTGGAVAFAVDELGLEDNFLVTNADTWNDADICQIYSKKDNCIGIVMVENANRFGRVFYQKNIVRSFEEKTLENIPGWINAGIYCLSKSCFEDWDGKPFSLENNLFPFLVRNKQLNCRKLFGCFKDIGVPDDYKEFCDLVASERK